MRCDGLVHADAEERPGVSTRRQARRRAERTRRELPCVNLSLWPVCRNGASTLANLGPVAALLAIHGQAGHRFDARRCLARSLWSVCRTCVLTLATFGPGGGPHGSKVNRSRAGWPRGAATESLPKAHFRRHRCPLWNRQQGHARGPLKSARTGRSTMLDDRVCRGRRRRADPGNPGRLTA